MTTHFFFLGAPLERRAPARPELTPRAPPCTASVVAAATLAEVGCDCPYNAWSYEHHFMASPPWAGSCTAIVHRGNPLPMPPKSRGSAGLTGPAATLPAAAAAQCAARPAPTARTMDLENLTPPSATPCLARSRPTWIANGQWPGATHPRWLQPHAPALARPSEPPESVMQNKRVLRLKEI